MSKKSNTLPKPQIRRVTGSRMPADRFVITESVGTPDPAVIYGLMHGTTLVYMVRNYVRPDVCAKATQAVLEATEGHERTDGVTAREVGCGHFAKEMQEYLDRCAEGEAAMAKIYQRAGEHFAARISSDIQHALDPGMVLRPALHGGQAAQRLRAAMWTADGKYSLLCHEDFSQLSDDRQAGFEIQRVQHPVAVNFYPAMPASGGALRVWNIAPDARTREQLGILTSGHPYPLESLEGILYMDIEINAGDLVFLLGRFVHAVLASDGSVLDPRIVMNGFLGISEDGSTVIQWT